MGRGDRTYVHRGGHLPSKPTTTAFPNVELQHPSRIECVVRHGRLQRNITAFRPDDAFPRCLAASLLESRNGEQPNEYFMPTSRRLRYFDCDMAFRLPHGLIVLQSQASPVHNFLPSPAAGGGITPGLGATCGGDQRHNALGRYAACATHSISHSALSPKFSGGARRVRMARVLRAHSRSPQTANTLCSWLQYYRVASPRRALGSAVS